MFLAKEKEAAEGERKGAAREQEGAKREHIDEAGVSGGVEKVK